MSSSLWLNSFSNKFAILCSKVIDNTQKEVKVEALLDSSITGLVMSLEFVRKQEFKLKKIKKLIYMRNVDSSFNKKGLIEHMIKVNIYY